MLTLRSTLLLTLRGDGGGTGKKVVKDRSSKRSVLNAVVSQAISKQKETSKGGSAHTANLFALVEKVHQAFKDNAATSMNALLNRCSLEDLDKLSGFTSNATHYRIVQIVQVLFSEHLQVVEREKEMADLALTTLHEVFTCGAFL